MRSRRPVYRFNLVDGVRRRRVQAKDHGTARAQHGHSTGTAWTQHGHSTVPAGHSRWTRKWQRQGHDGDWKTVYAAMPNRLSLIPAFSLGITGTAKFV